MARGRPRKVDPAEVLEKAMAIFWERGYQGTSMNDLVQETGMAKPGIYANFGDKEELYKKALSYYVETYGIPTIDYLVSGGDPLELTLRNIMENVADFVTDPSQPGGCFVVNGVIDCANSQATLKTHTRACDQERRDAFYTRFQQAVDKGELPDGCDHRALADFFSAQLAALGVMGRAGIGRAEMQNLIETALSVLPPDKKSH